MRGIPSGEDRLEVVLDGADVLAFAALTDEGVEVCGAQPFASSVSPLESGGAAG